MVIRINGHYPQLQITKGVREVIVQIEGCGKFRLGTEPAEGSMPETKWRGNGRESSLDCSGGRSSARGWVGGTLAELGRLDSGRALLFAMERNVSLRQPA
jgi:hypothetical protein